MTGGSVPAAMFRSSFARVIRAVSACAFAFVILATGAAFPATASGQVVRSETKPAAPEPYAPPWEYSPYRVHLWLVDDGSRSFSPAAMRTVRESLLDEIDVAFGASCRASASRAPSDVAAAARASLGHLTVFDFDRMGRGWWFAGADGVPVVEFDKIYLVVLRDDGVRFGVELREFEIPSYQAGKVHRADAASIAQIPRVVSDLVSRAFTRLARVEKTYEVESTVETPEGPRIMRQDRAAVRFKAAGLATEGTQSLLPPVGSPMTVVLRSNDRLGVPTENGVAEMEFTYVLAERIRGSLVDGPVYSGLRSPFGARSSRRVQKFVRYLPYSQGPTTLTIVSPPSEAQPSEPLGGYDIYSREPEGEISTFLGETDWRGEFVVPPADQPLRIVYAKSGDRILARLPIPPGLHARVTAVVPDDSFRLEAEGAVAAFQSRLMDLIARRQALAVRIRKKVEQAQRAEAERLLEEEFKPMFDRTGLTFELEELRKRFSTEDPAAARRIEAMFDATRSVLNKFLDTELDRQLEAQVKQAG
ncbi:MAG TPA: hypothetical protein VGN57_06105 [Pirellulaceae bacterium]|jgi:hypothetical protein|nr:hypothetical protein [Pirellulaceae bacterium]